MIIRLTAGKCLRFLIGEKNHQSFLVEIRNSRFLMAEVKSLLPVPNAGGERLEVSHTVSNRNKKKQ